MPELVKIADVGSLAPGKAIAIDLQGTKIALFNVDGTYYAIDDTCTHRGGPLSEGDIDGTVVTCPWHSAEFEITTGEVVNPPADCAVKSYPVTVEGSEIKIEISKKPGL